LNPLKKLLGQTAVYGLSTILARTANYVVLVPLYTYIFKDQEQFGINTEIYAYISFLNIILTYGMETAFFNFYSKRDDKAGVYSTSLISLIVSTVFFLLVGLLFTQQISGWMDYAGHEDFIVWMMLIICSDALMVIPFAKLRSENRPAKFALIKTCNIGLNVLLNVFFIVICKGAYEKDPASTFGQLYDPEIGIGYGFLCNVLANIITLLFLVKEYTEIKYHFDKKIWKDMITYALPLIIVGFAGMINETFDRIILGKMLDSSIARKEVGIYGACYKLSIIMTIFIQAFRFAAEPFFFNTAKEHDSKKTNAQVTKYFVIFCALIFLGTMMNLEWLKYFISKPYWGGLAVVPILLIANLFLGVYYNLSIWYKLTEQTRFGAYLTLVGAAITLIINFVFIPQFSYMASAWATLFSYGTMMILSYIIGKKHYPIKYNLRSMGFFFITALALFFISLTYKGKFPDKMYVEVILNNVLFLFFVWMVYKLEFPNLKNNKSGSPKESLPDSALG
jgi:O-antigen/teichoic acid export membrane protein